MQSVNNDRSMFNWYQISVSQKIVERKTAREYAKLQSSGESDAVKGNRNNWHVDTIVQLAVLSAFESQIASRYQKSWRRNVEILRNRRAPKAATNRQSMSRQIQLLFQLLLSPSVFSVSLLARLSRSWGYQSTEIISDRILMALVVPSME